MSGLWTYTNRSFQFAIKLALLIYKPALTGGGKMLTLPKIQYVERYAIEFTRQ
jgi:hypothetical protein